MQREGASPLRSHPHEDRLSRGSLLEQTWRTIPWGGRPRGGGDRRSPPLERPSGSLMNWKEVTPRASYQANPGMCGGRRQEPSRPLPHEDSPIHLKSTGES